MRQLTVGLVFLSCATTPWRVPGYGGDQHPCLWARTEEGLTGVALREALSRPGASGRCVGEGGQRLEFEVSSAGAGVRLTVRAERDGKALWARDFVRTKTEQETAEALTMAAVGDFTQFLALSAHAGRLCPLPEEKLSQRVVEWFATRGVALSPVQRHVLESEAVTLMDDQAGLPTGTPTPDAQRRLRVLTTPVHDDLTLITVHRIDADGSDSRLRAAENAIAEIIDNEQALAAMGGVVNPDVPALADFAPLESVAPVPSNEVNLQAACQLRLASLDDVAPGHVMLVPDLEGSVQAPEMVRRVACGVLALGRPLTLALDIDSVEQAALNAWLESPDDESALLKLPFFRRQWQDGRSSHAMLELLTQVKTWRQHHRPITVLAIDWGMPGNPRMAMMAHRLVDHRAQHPDRVLVVFVSNTAARLTLGTSWDDDLQPLGYRLTAAGLPVTAFDVAFNTGVRWTCRLFSKGRLRCGAWVIHPGDENTDYDLLHSTTIFRHDVRDGTFTGRACLGEISPSPPAAPGFVDEAAPPYKRP